MRIATPVAAFCGSIAAVYASVALATRIWQLLRRGGHRTAELSGSELTPAVFHVDPEDPIDEFECHGRPLRDVSWPAKRGECTPLWGTERMFGTVLVTQTAQPENCFNHTNNHTQASAEVPGSPQSVCTARTLVGQLHLIFAVI